ncbi:MAG: hypothetical protein LBU53_04740 [Zoogloeaceae bacterium]|jgi:hypothetical protein|nr:hypothetical protein [Zoogloeaceae bacterium]
MSEPFISALDILDQHSPGSPAQVQQLREAVFSIRKRAKQHLDQGLTTDETEAARGLLKAAEIAEEIVGKLAV